MLATGGNIRSAGTALVGENGPKMLSLPRGAQVTPLDGQGVTINVVVNGALDPAAVAAQLESMLAKYKRVQKSGRKLAFV